MKKSMRDTLRTMGVIAVLFVVMGSMPFLPWWSFTIPLTGLGLVISWKNWQVHSFLTGFVCGFLIWAGTTLYFGEKYPGDIFRLVGMAPRIIAIVVAGLLGGLLTALSIYTGKSILTTQTDQSTL